MTVKKLVRKALKKHDDETVQTGFRRNNNSAKPIAELRRESDRWSLQKQGLRQSTIYLWLRCREQFRLQLVEGWTSYRTSAAIDNGNLWHWLLDRRHNGKLRTNNLDGFLRTHAKRFRDDNPNMPLSRLNAMHLSYVQTRALWPFYCKLFPDDWKWHGVEKQFSFKHFPKVGHSQDKRAYSIPINGIFDGVFEDDNGDLWLFETKTKSQIDEFEIQDAMQLDVQVMLYLYAIKQVYGRWPKGVKYNVIRKPIVRKKEEDPVAYGARLSKQIRKNPDHYFKRWNMKVSATKIQAWVDNTLDQILLDIQAWAEGRAGHYVTTRNLITKFGRCDMFEVITNNDFSNVYRRKKVIADLER